MVSAPQPVRTRYGRILKPYPHLQSPLSDVCPRQQAAQHRLTGYEWASGFTLKLPSGPKAHPEEIKEKGTQYLPHLWLGKPILGTFPWHFTLFTTVILQHHSEGSWIQACHTPCVCSIYHITVRDFKTITTNLSASACSFTKLWPTYQVSFCTWK